MKKYEHITHISAVFIVSFASFFISTPALAVTLPSGFCHTFTQTLQTGKSGPDITALQLILASQGLLSNTNVGSPKYDSKLATAVTLFQEKYKKDVLQPTKLTRGTGTVGPATLKKLNQLYGCSANANTNTAAVISEVATPTPYIPTPTPRALPSVEIINGYASRPEILQRNDKRETTRAAVTLYFTIVNRGEDPLYISKNPQLAVSTISNLDSMSASANYISSRTSVSINPATTYYVAPYSNRKFEVSVLLTNLQGARPTVDGYLTINRVFYSTTTDNIGNINDEKAVFTDSISTGSITLGS